MTGITWRDASNNVLRTRNYNYTLAGMISRVDMEDGGRVGYTYDSLDRLTAEKRTDPYGQVLAWDLFEYDLAGNRTRKTILDASSNALMTVNSALSTGNRLASWAVQETNLMARFPVVGHASEPIGTNDRFGALWVSNATAGGMSAKPEVEGTNFWVYDFTVGLGTQQVVAAIRDMAGNMAYVTNTVIPSVLTNGAYQYNAAGCVTNMAYTGPGVAQTLRLTWDGQYQLTGVSTGAVVESYAYDALGRRVMTAAGGVTNWHVYDGAQVIADLNGTGAVLRTYVWGPGIDNLLAIQVYTNSGGTTSVSSVFYAVKDHLNSVLAMTDSAGQIVEQYRYDAWGRVLGVFDANSQQLGNSSIGNRYLWQGREYSWATRLYNFRARWYDPITGRWLSDDPIGISGGLNQYVFCANNPVNMTDPLGLYQWSRGSKGVDWSASEQAFIRGVVQHAKAMRGYCEVRDFLKEKYGYDLDTELTEGRGNVKIGAGGNRANSYADYDDLVNRINYGLYSQGGREDGQCFDTLNRNVKDSYAITLLHELAHHAADVDTWFGSRKWAPEDKDIRRAVEQLINPVDKALRQYEGAYVNYLLGR